MTIILLAFIVYNIINIFTYSSFLKRFSFFKSTRRDFYECGFKPLTQSPIQIPLAIILICCFFLIYDIELLFLIPFTNALSILSFLDFLLIFLFFFFFFLSLLIDIDRHALLWQH